ncbi:MAG TPA: NgoFVII family restriction endonuclease, partial [Eubacteriaceae bacterium]|nr:NgoFVII family restriction endonuclease [Eubacteriaceae bacterium]
MDTNPDRLLSNSITGDDDHLYVHLKEAIQKAIKIDIIVAFLMESGVRMILNDLKEALNRGCEVRILCGNYLNITQPQALYLLKDELEDRVILKFYNQKNRSFHAKAYIIESENSGEIFIGSSNLSRSALTDGIEWNYRMTKEVDPKSYRSFKEKFEDLFLDNGKIIDHKELRKYSLHWQKPKFFSYEEEGGKIEEPLPSEESTYQVSQPDSAVIPFPKPLGVQIEALYELKKTREDGWDKGLVVAATGVGKTFLAAFDSLNYNRILFIAHREEILLQAKRSFEVIQPKKSTGLYYGGEKEKDADVLFATVQTLGKNGHLTEENFPKDAFDYIVVDEFHHATADNYKRILEWFEPGFLLGLTATPERMDNKDVFVLCDYNLVYEIRLKEAINKGMLVPFKYYGIFDDTDFSKVKTVNGMFEQKDLEKALSIHQRADLIYNHYKKHQSDRAIGFCATRNHAVYMAEQFQAKNIPSCAVISGAGNHSEFVLDRKEAIDRLKKGSIKVIFAVDMFNEGLDVPEIDTVLFLRPTESPTVFLQQLGRGLRKSRGKKHLHVLDFIGNYKKAELIPYLLVGNEKEKGRKKKIREVLREENFPTDCIIDFDFQVIDLFEALEKKGRKAYDKLVDEFERVETFLGHRPSRLEFFTYMDDELAANMKSNKNIKIFNDYMGFLNMQGRLSEKEMELVQTPAHEFIKTIENTSMSKTYKMPVLYAFYNNGAMKRKIGEEDLYQSFQRFYANPANGVDMKRDKSTQNYKKWTNKEYVNLARRNPLKFLAKTHGDWFYWQG